MYQVAILPDDTESRIIISAMHNNMNWHLESDLSFDEINRIENRFDEEIVSKLEKLIQSVDNSVE